MTRTARAAPGTALLLLVAGLFPSGCGLTPGSAAGAPAVERPVAVAPDPAGAPVKRLDPLLEELEERTFRYFLDLAHPVTGLVPDRWPTPSFSSVAAVGFGLTAYPIGVERGWITREEARPRVLRTLRFLLDAPQGPEPAGVAGHRGLLYHFLDMESGRRFGTVELSTIDTALFLAGALFCQSYFDGDHPDEAAIREAADALYRRADWTFVRPRPPLLGMGWTPETGYIAYDWKGYDESMILYVLALGSPTHPVGPEAWAGFTSTYVWAPWYGPEHVAFGPLFGHQYSHVWIDFRGIRDAYMRGKGIDYFENSRRATLSQRAYAIANPLGFADYGENVWGLTACDGPADVTRMVNGRPVRFYTYGARATSAVWSSDDGTLAPTAAGGSIAFAPEVCLPALKEMRRRYGDDLWGRYGFLDAFNPTFTFTDFPVHHGRVVPGAGWFDSDYIGIDQGPILAMIENHRSELVWRTMRKNPYVVNGLRRAGFTGGWLDLATR
jgi:hypothetical protein